MGRRAKNKQGDPPPLVEVQANAAPRPSAKKLGKRKADPEDHASTKRPTKKTRESQGKKGGTKVSKNSTSDKPSGKRRKTVEDESASSDGWENVEDDTDLESPGWHGSSSARDPIRKEREESVHRRFDERERDESRRVSSGPLVPERVVRGRDDDQDRSLYFSHLLYTTFLVVSKIHILKSALLLKA